MNTFVPSTAGLNAPAGLAFDSDGILYASNFGGSSISAIATDGSVNNSYATGLSRPNFIAVLPEPSIVAVVALWTLGLLAGRRRRV